MAAVPIGRYQLQGVGNSKFCVAVQTTEMQPKGTSQVRYVIGSGYDQWAVDEMPRMGGSPI